MQLGRTLAISTSAIAIAAGIATAQDVVQWKVEDGGNGHWYQHHTAQMSWHEAQLTAKSLGGHLVTIQSQDENDFVHDLMPTDANEAWIGLREEFCGGEPDGWFWENQEPVNWLNWSPNEPNGMILEDHAAMYAQTGQWDDRADLNSSFIEWSADCNGDGIVDYGQILDETLTDTNFNGIPDICEVLISLGACCINGVCVPTTMDGCFSAAGSYAGDGISCEESECLEFCPVDINQDGNVGTADLLLILANWGPCP